MAMESVANKCLQGKASRLAAQYVRMSTDQQQYSPEIQKRAIADYATRHGLLIVESYEDFGRSGITLRSRPALIKLLADVQKPDRHFDVVLVFDVSRWGRFQDVDESAYYEYLCRQAGVRVVYCNEIFDNDGSPASTIVKALKRALAGEYSRELSGKTFAGQCRIAELGFWQGGPPGYGLQRVLVDSSGRRKEPLQRRQYKSIHTDRVIIVPGPPHEVALVRRIFQWYAYDGISPERIAERLNSFGICKDENRSWSRSSIGSMLGNEKYAGTNVFGRASAKLHGNRRRNRPSEWIRAIGAFEPVVDRHLFEAAQARRVCNTIAFENVELLSRLTRCLKKSGTLNSQTIDNDPNLPSSYTFTRRFGSLANAYRAIGFETSKSDSMAETYRVLRPSLAAFTRRVIETLEADGHRIVRFDDGKLICVDGELRIKITARSVYHNAYHDPTWSVRWPDRYPVDLFVVLRVDCVYMTGTRIYVFPRGSLPRRRLLTLLARGGEWKRNYDMFAFSDMAILQELTARCPLEVRNGR
jgi:DNA invertase Pin-like site-specific DNA recombinase